MANNSSDDINIVLTKTGIYKKDSGNDMRVTKYASQDCVYVEIFFFFFSWRTTT